MKYFSDKTEGLITVQDLKRPSVKFGYAMIFLILVIFALICIVPVVWVFLSAFKTPAEMYKIPPTFFPESIDFKNMGNVLGKVNFGKYFFNTLCIIVGCWGCDILFNGMCGYVLSRIKPLGTPLMETLIFWSMLLPGVSMAPLYMTFVDMPIFHINLTGTFFPLWMIAGCNAFHIMLFRNFFNSIPMDYVEAARIDGCNNINIFMRIILPLSKPILVVVSITNIIASWSNFFWPFLILGATDREPISVLLYKISNSSGIQLMDNEVMMVTLLAIIPPMIVYSILSKHITGGINMSGIKG